MLKLNRILLYGMLIAVALGFIFPLWVMVVTSFKTLDEIRAGYLLSWPENFYLGAWISAWSETCVGVTCSGVKPYFLNSLYMSVPAVLFSTLIGSFNGYAITQWPFRGVNLFFNMLLLGCFLPFQMIILPMAQLLGRLGLSTSLWGLILVHIIYGTAFTTLFFRNYYITLPKELVKAAKIDGAGFFTIYFRIIAPLSKPIFAVSIIWQFTQIWNDFLFGAVFSSGEHQPMTVALNNIVNTSTGVKEYNVQMASAIFAALPTLFVYIVGGKYFIRGLTSGAVKG